MNVKSKISENSILLIVIAVISTGLIFGVSYHLSQREVKVSVENMERVDPKTVPDIKEPTPLEKLWKKNSIIPAIKELNSPFKKFNLLNPITLNRKKRVFKNDSIKIRLGVTEKNHKMGNNDGFLVELEITNPSKKWLAFRVVTEKNNSFVTCHNYKFKRNHGFLLEPGATVTRFEGCSFSKKAAYLKILLIQTLILPEAGFVTLSRVGTVFGLTRRLEKSHKVNRLGRLSPCPLYTVKESVNKKIAADPEVWFKTMKFLARHDCIEEKLQ